MDQEAPSAGDATCPRCGKAAALCVCADIAPLDNRIELLILQHPQEQDVELGTARLAVLHLKRAKLKIGLSWPSLAKLLGRSVEPRRWAVLYLGSARPGELAPGREIVLLDRKGAALADQEAALAEIEGVILLDGSWSQAKALWWRNAWMLKCRRVALAPRHPSRYGKLRREPRREALATIEAAALLLSRLENNSEIERALLAGFDKLLQRYRAGRRAAASPASASSSGPSASS
jgi:tRNA-uridine aminocarboxypropyltransferase